jgi:hypothetical protein
MMPISAQAQNTINSSVGGVIGDPKTEIHDLAFVAVDKHGGNLVEHASRKRGPHKSAPPTTLGLFWLPRFSNVGLIRELPD